MPWQQATNPLHSIWLSSAVALLPVVFIFWALIIKRMKGYLASVFACLAAFIIAIIVYQMPVKLASLSALNGACYGLFPICWIIIPAVLLFNLTVESGRFEIIKHSLAGITPDRRLQALLIAFSFGSFLEGTAGFGAPVAITAAMLVGLGFKPLYAAGLCLLANTAPVAFGSIGIPITVASQVSGLPEMAISKMVGRTLPFLSVLLPLYLVLIMCGWKKTREVLPAVFVSGLSFASLQWSVSNFIGPALPDVIAGIGSIICLVVFLRFWKPKEHWDFDEIPVIKAFAKNEYSSREILNAFSPFIILTLFIVAWGILPVKRLLEAGTSQFAFPGLHNQVINENGEPIPHIYKLNTLSAAGTALFISAFVSAPLLGFTAKKTFQILSRTIIQLRFAVLTIAAILAFAYLLNDSGMTLTMAAALSATGILFPLFAPLLGWLGVFITGSDTSSNALFAKLQAATADTIGVDPVITVGANISGGVVGKMISPQSIAVAAAAGNIVGRESELFRFTVKHSFILLFIISGLVFAEAYLLKWMVPAYQLQSQANGSQRTSPQSGITYIIALAVILIVLFVIAKKSSPKHLKEKAI